MKSLNVLADYFYRTFSFLFLPDNDLVSEEYERIMDNEEDRESYLKAVNKAKSESQEQRVKLTTGDTLVVSP